MKSSLMVAVLLLGGCVHGGASEPHKQQVDMGRQIVEEIFNQGTDAGSPLARDLLVVHILPSVGWLPGQVVKVRCKMYCMLTRTTAYL